ncbi:MAG TPA: hypothetical protein VEI82_08960, partial [Myxococcota bacterium]|nr:hypothetical protein [Myxococcota bacterium]
MTANGRGLCALLCAALLLQALPALGDSAAPTAARLATALDGQEPRVQAALLALPAERADGLRLGVQFEIDPGWHIDAREPGETGLPTRV